MWGIFCVLRASQQKTFWSGRLTKFTSEMLDPPLHSDKKCKTKLLQFFKDFLSIKISLFIPTEWKINVKIVLTSE